MVGITALAMTVATSAEYCAWSMIWCESPKSADIVPNVSPVDMSKVVYMASLLGEAKTRVTGYTPIIFAAIFTASSNANAPGAAASCGTDTKEPARIK